MRADTIAYQVVQNGTPALVLLDPAAFASGSVPDPSILVRRLKRGSIPFTGYTFTFDAATGAGLFDYYNGNAFFLSALTVIISPGGPALDAEAMFACGVDSQLAVVPFSDCSFAEFGSDASATEVAFFGSPGLPPYSHFAIVLDGFPSNANVIVNAVPGAPAPEPGAWILLLTGLMILAGVRWGRAAAHRGLSSTGSRIHASTC